MLKSLERFFSTHTASPGGQHGRETHQHALRLATAALLLEVMAADDDDHPAERQAITQSLASRFQLEQHEIDTLIEQAAQRREQASDYHQFTSLINRHFSAEEKKQLMEQLWQVAYADRQLDSYEEHLIRKIADLLHIPHQVFISRKHRAQASTPD